MKQKLFKTMTALLCLLAMLTGALVSCGKKEQPKPDNTKTTPATTTGNGGSDEPTEIDYTTFITKETFDDETIRILVQINEVRQFDVGEEVPTDSVDLAFYQRNSKVEDTHEVELVFTTASDQADYTTKLNTASMGGDNYDLVEMWHWYNNGWTYFADMLQYDDILHFDNPYWSSGFGNNAQVNGKQYTAAGFVNTSVYANAMVVYYNEHLRLNYGLEEFAPLVESGDWTIETMLQMMEEATVLTGNEDTNKYGLGYNLWSGRAFLWGCGLQLSTYTDGELNITLANEPNYNAFTAVKKFLTGTQSTYYGGGSKWDGGLYGTDKSDLALFKTYRLLFDSDVLEKSQEIAQTMPNFGLLPMPKLNKQQDDYITPVNGISPVGIMKTSSNPRRAAIILETFSIYSYLIVRPEYYDSALKLRYQSDASTAKMVDFIVERLSLDFLFINSSAFESVADKPFNLIDPNKNLQGEGYYSYMGALQNRMEGYLEKFMQVYADADNSAE